MSSLRRCYSYIDNKLEKLQDRSNYADAVIERSRKLDARIKEIRDENSADLAFRKNSKNIILNLENECTNLDLENKELKEKILESAFFEVSQSLALSKEPYSTSVLNVDALTKKVIRGRFLAFLFSEKAKLKKSIDELIHLQSSALCLSAEESHNPYFIEESLAEEEQNLNAETIIINSLNEGQESGVHASIEERAGSEINHVLAEELGSSLFSENSEIPFAKLNFEVKNEETNIEKESEKYLDVLKQNSGNEGIIAEVVDGIEDIRNIEQQSIDLPQELLEKIQNLSKIGPVRALKFFANTKESVEKATDAINKLHTLLSNGNSVPSEVAEDAERIRTSAYLTVQSLATAAKRATLPQTMKSTEAINFPAPRTVEVEELDQDQVKKTDETIQQVQEMVNKHLSKQNELLDALEDITKHNNDQNLCGITLDDDDDDEKNNQIEEIIALQKEIQKRQMEQIEILSKHLETIPDDALDSVVIEEQDVEEVDTKKYELEMTIPKEKKQVFKLNGIEEIDPKLTISKNVVPDYKPRIEIVQAFTRLPEDKNLEAINKHIEEFNQSVANEDDTITILKEKREFLQSEYEDIVMKLKEKIMKENQETKSKIKDSKSKLDKILELIKTNTEKKENVAKSIDDLKQKIACDEQINSIIREMDSIKDHIAKEKAEIKARNPRRRNGPK